MSMNLPPLPATPSLRDKLRDGLAQLLETPDVQHLLAYGASAGSLRDRAAGARWLQPVLGEVDPAQIVVCAGAQCALTALLTMLTRPGDTILTDMLTYPVFRALAAQLDVRLAGVAADQDGMLPDALEQVCRSMQPKAIYCVPTMHNPTAVTMPPERRRAVAEIAVRHTVAVIEDDAYGMLPSSPVPAIVSFAAGAGYYVGTLSKCLTPGLRVAYVVAPGRSDAGRLAAATRATSLMPSPLMVSLLSAWIGDGTAEALCDGVRAEATARQTISQTILPQAATTSHKEGLHVWLNLPEQWDRMDFVMHLRRLGLALVASDAFLVSGVAPSAVRVCLGVAESRATLRLALQDLVTALAEEAPTLLANVV
jgi:DNA-binding transcriptional MocR family regulator